MYFAGKCYLLRKLKVMGPTIFLVTEQKESCKMVDFLIFPCNWTDLKHVKDKEHNNR